MAANTKDLTVYFYHVTYAFQNESTLYSCLNVKELRTHNHLVHQQILKHLAKLAKG